MKSNHFLVVAYTFLDIARTPSVIAAQQVNGSAELYGRPGISRDFTAFTPKEAEFIARRDSFYLATASETGWPYVQHRGGPEGFLRVLDETTLGFADFRGNRQYVSVGNLAGSDKVSLFLMDYAHRRRLKILGHARITEDPEVLARLAVPGYRAKVERGILIEVAAFDWNCPQHITPRFSLDELKAMAAARDG